MLLRKNTLSLSLSLSLSLMCINKRDNSDLLLSKVSFLNPLHVLIHGILSVNRTKTFIKLKVEIML